LRCRPDFLPDDLRFIPDYKSTASAAPKDFERSVFNYGYALQAALYLEGIAAVFGEDDRQFFFISQEKDPPYIVQPYCLSQSAYEYGRREMRKAINIFANCLNANKWPSYSEDFVTIDLPLWIKE
jgi:hypothetical protein